jgi:hypothetical protein
MQRRILGLFVILLVISSWLPSRWARRVSKGPRDFLVAILVPAQWIQGTATPITDRSDLRGDRRGESQLQNDHAEAIRQMVSLRFKLEQANLRIAKLTAIRSRLGMQGVALREARIINRSGRPGKEVLTLDVGSRDGVTGGLAVVDGIHLVGRVMSVTSARCTVRPINTVPSHLAARVRAPKAKLDRAAAQILLEAAPDGRRFTERINVGLSIQGGELAHLTDRNWPDLAQGFVIGKVTNVVKDQNDPLQHRLVTVIPIRSVDLLHDVTVLVPIQAPRSSE